MNQTTCVALCAAGVFVAGAPALGAYNSSIGASAPTYSTTLTFDEPGGPVGDGLATNLWQASHGVTSLASGDAFQRVGDFSVFPGQSWLGTGNSFTGNFGVFMTFDNDLTDFSAQIWDPSGPPSPFGGGAVAFIFDNGVEVSSFAFEPAWGGVGDEWLNISADGGMVFDEIRILGFGFDPTTYVDNASWNAVPGSGVAGLLGIAGMVGIRRRRA